MCVRLRNEAGGQITGGLPVDVRFHATLRQAVGGKHVDVEWSDGLTVWGFVT
jgi:hypothetical protein